ncbi:AraC family transcriptional regulator [Haloechinothrix sp. YIM 98757]|uniref:AraC family transcriptional regulator n=1 Tax=Haloechinothrix aidingensis TaxID=2752311 RepID=A0A837ZXA2_9PSEU|nr:AraC family transcriptional regulator [Haloechinothrix aidingensis]MBA0125256.1 AraC family transcriptional regulator [Haloechinothrix aidingensis]
MDELPRPAVREWTFPRGATSVLLMTRYAEERGVDAATVLRGTGLSARRVADPGAQLEARQELAVIRNLVASFEDRHVLGLEIGRRYRASTFGVFGFACVSSPTLRDAIAFALRYFDLSFAFCIPTVEVADEELVLSLHDERVPPDVREVLVDRDLAAIHTVIGDLLGTALPLRALALRTEAPGHAARYREAFGVTPGFGAPANTATFDRVYLDRPLPQANEHTMAICQAQCRELVTRKRARSGTAQEVRSRLARPGGLGMGIDEIARELGMSQRTLRRRLDEEGTGYRALLDEVREALAEEMLGTGALSVSDVAIRLGYAESTSFVYAFKRWKGVTPAAYQREFGR